MQDYPRYDEEDDKNISCQLIRFIIKLRKLLSTRYREQFYTLWGLFLGESD